ncbi:hypothetical protein Z043_104106, partial [Scleropages formosus]
GAQEKRGRLLIASSQSSTLRRGQLEPALRRPEQRPPPSPLKYFEKSMESLLDNPMKAVLYLKELTTIVQNQQSAQSSPESADEDKKSPCCKSLVPQTPTTLCRSVGLARKAE